MLDEPLLVAAAHRDYIKAGAQVINLNTYCATPLRLARDGDPAMFVPLYAAALSAAHQAREESGRAGCALRAACRHWSRVITQIACQAALLACVTTDS